MISFLNSTEALEIPTEFRIKNESPGYCTWVSIETIGRVHKIQSVENLFENRKKEKDVVFFINGEKNTHKRNLGYDYAIKNKLNHLKVKYILQYDDNLDKTLFKKYAKSSGCIFKVKKGASLNNNIYHSLIMTDYNEESIDFYDCNAPVKNWTAKKEWLDYYWTGWVLVILKEEP